MKIQIRFDGPPEHIAGRFIEVEDESGRSISVGEWTQDGSDWLLKIDTDDLLQTSQIDRLTQRGRTP